MGVAPELRTPEGIASHWYSPLADGSGFRLEQPTALFPRLELQAEAE
jgi:methionyl-tRNA synthetase